MLKNLDCPRLNQGGYPLTDSSAPLTKLCSNYFIMLFVSKINQHKHDKMTLSILFES